MRPLFEPTDLDKEKREVDFLIVEGCKPWLMVEAKLSDNTVSPALRYFHERFKPSQGSVQLVRNLEHARTGARADVRVLPASWVLSKM